MTDTQRPASAPRCDSEMGGSDQPARQPAMADSDLATLAGAAAVVFPLMYFASELVEVAQGDFSTARLALAYLGEAGIVFVVLGLYAVQRPRIGRLGLYGALAGDLWLGAEVVSSVWHHRMSHHYEGGIAQ